MFKEMVLRDRLPPHSRLEYFGSQLAEQLRAIAVGELQENLIDTLAPHVSNSPESVPSDGSCDGAGSIAYDEPQRATTHPAHDGPKPRCRSGARTTVLIGFVTGETFLAQHLLEH
jgi:hypothetical protein